MFGKNFWFSLLFILIIPIVLISTPGHNVIALDRNSLERDLRASVKLGTLDIDGELSGTCSGTILDKQGFILTNFHCVGQTDLYGEDKENGMKHGDLYNPEGKVIVSINADTRKPPLATYIAKYWTGTPDQDIAILKIVSFLDSKEELPAEISLIPNILSDSNKVDIYDEVTNIGYPGAGGATVTLTDGHISGFQDGNFTDQEEKLDGIIDWFKTDALVNHGNSGGTAVNPAGEVIGIPSAMYFDPKSGDQMYFIKPVNQAVPYIERARQLSKSEIESEDNQDNQSSVPAGKHFGEILFGTGYEKKTLTGTSAVFESGVTTVHATAAYNNMRKGVAWGYAWYYDGQEQLRRTKKWDYEQSGLVHLWLNNDDGMADGKYTLKLFYRNDQENEAEFTVGDISQEPTPKPPDDQKKKEVVISGKVIDFATKEPLEGVRILVLQAGKTIADFQHSLDPEWIFTSTQTDNTGNFTLSRNFPREGEYGLIARREDYKIVGVDAAIKLNSESPDVITLDPLELEKN